jgi:hypothetical protein
MRSKTSSQYDHPADRVLLELKSQFVFGMRFRQFGRRDALTHQALKLLSDGLSKLLESLRSSKSPPAIGP